LVEKRVKIAIVPMPMNMTSRNARMSLVASERILIFL